VVCDQLDKVGASEETCIRIWSIVFDGVLFMADRNLMYYSVQLWALAAVVRNFMAHIHFGNGGDFILKDFSCSIVTPLHAYSFLVASYANRKVRNF